MRILIVTTNPSKAAYFEALLADAGAAFVMPCAARRESWALDSLSLDPEGGLPGCAAQDAGADGKERGLLSSDRYFGKCGRGRTFLYYKRP